MKTALQELIEEFDGIINDDTLPEHYRVGIVTAQSRAMQLREKEKKQIIEAYSSGKNEGYFDGGETALDYYDKTFTK